MHYTLKDLGWSDFFARQTGAMPLAQPFRISAVHRDRLAALGPSGEASLTTPAQSSTGDYAVGDWVLADTSNQISQRLDRQTLIQRRGAGTDARIQLIAANVDVLFIVTSCNDDFNVPRLERYLALAYEAGCYPVILLTKADLCDDPLIYADQITQAAPTVPVLCLDGKDMIDLQKVADWCGPGQTGAFLGSSGVGKTTLANGLTNDQAATGAIRKDDSKGRHVTTSRALKRMLNGGWIIDTPGMRALRIVDVEAGVSQLFDDIEQLALGCRFSNCQHDVEPGCAIQGAIAAGDLATERLTRWRKLVLEDQRNSESLAQSHARDRGFGKMVRNAQKTAKKLKNR